MRDFKIDAVFDKQSADRTMKIFFAFCILLLFRLTLKHMSQTFNNENSFCVNQVHYRSE